MNKTGGLIHIPPIMIGEMGKWIMSTYSVQVLAEMHTVPQETRTKEWVQVREEWKKRNTLGLNYLGADERFPIDLKGWKYLSKVDTNRIRDFYPKGIKISFSPQSEINGFWDDTKGHMKIWENYQDSMKFEMLISQGKFRRASNFMMGKLKEVIRVFHHEATHMAQAFLELGVFGKIQNFKDKRIPAPGLPSKRVMTPDITQDLKKMKQRNLDEEETHGLDDSEFYTRLRDEVYDFKREYRKSSLQQKKEAIPQWVGTKALIKSQKAVPFINASKWFLTLKKHAPGKWKKAILEFTKSVL